MALMHTGQKKKDIEVFCFIVSITHLSQKCTQQAEWLTGFTLRLKEYLKIRIE